MIFDTHAHLNFKDFDKDRKEVIERCKRERVSVINIGTNMESSREVLDIAAKHSNMYASVGLHPLHIKEKFLLSDYKKLSFEKVVAVGETGLDKKGERLGKQKQVFLKHIELASEKKLPLILHCRGEHAELLKILKEKYAELNGGVIHCFTGKRRDARQYIELGFYLGINGIIFKMNMEKVIKETPLKKILLETDCPFLSPFEDKKRNEPIFVRRIAEEVARIKEISQEEVERVTTKNAKELFSI